MQNLQKFAKTFTTEEWNKLCNDKAFKEEMDRALESDYIGGLAVISQGILSHMQNWKPNATQEY